MKGATDDDDDKQLPLILITERMIQFLWWYTLDQQKQEQFHTDSWWEGGCTGKRPKMKNLFPTTLGIFPSLTEQTYAMQIVCGSRPFLWNADTIRPMGGSLAAVKGGQDLGVASSSVVPLCPYYPPRQATGRRWWWRCTYWYCCCRSLQLSSYWGGGPTN